MIRRFGVFHLGQVLPVLRLYLGVSPSLFLIYWHADLLRVWGKKNSQPFMIRHEICFSGNRIVSASLTLFSKLTTFCRSRVIYRFFKLFAYLVITSKWDMFWKFTQWYILHRWLWPSKFWFMLFHFPTESHSIHRYSCGYTNMRPQSLATTPSGVSTVDDSSKFWLSQVTCLYIVDRH